MPTSSRWRHFLVTFVVIFVLNVILTFLFYYSESLARERCITLPPSSGSGTPQQLCPLDVGYRFIGWPAFVVIEVSSGKWSLLEFLPKSLLSNVVWMAVISAVFSELLRCKPNGKAARNLP